VEYILHEQESGGQLQNLSEITCKGELRVQNVSFMTRKGYNCNKVLVLVVVVGNKKLDSFEMLMRGFRE
jgi:hypothetical protein